jgi:hypothetical protein
MKKKRKNVFQTVSGERIQTERRECAQGKARKYGEALSFVGNDGDIFSSLEMILAGMNAPSNPGS